MLNGCYTFACPGKYSNIYNMCIGVVLKQSVKLNTRKSLLSKYHQYIINVNKHAIFEYR